jgi:hypothetical protein
MLIANMVILLLIAACAAYQFLKGNFVKAFATIIIAVCASIIALSYFEMVAGLLAGQSESLAPWSQLISFVLLLVLSFAVLQTLLMQLSREPIDLGLWPERIGRVACGIILGLIASGLLLTAVAMAPLPGKYPYQRFEPRSLNPDEPAKPLFSPDGFVTGWVGVASKGSLAGKKSFAAMHPNFLNELFLNRLAPVADVPALTSSAAIDVEREKTVWFAPQGITDTEGQQVPAKSGYTLVIARIGFLKNALKDAGQFTLSQLRLVCKPSTDSGNPLTGQGQSVYPIGYMKSQNQLQRKKLSDQIKIQRDKLEGRVQWIDFAFYVPTYSVPVLAEFKLNNAVLLPPPVPADEAPASVPFTESSTSRNETAKRPQPSRRDSAKSTRQRDSSQRRRGLSPPSRLILGDQLDEQ